MAKIFMIAALAGFLFACSDEGVPTPMGLEDPSGSFTTLFHAEFSLWDHSDYAGGCCNNPPNCHLTLVGNGNGMPMGNISATFSITCNKSAGTYCDGAGKFVAPNGDELYFVVKEGKMFPNTGENCDKYGTCFNDLAEITGGTGIFRDATGFFYTNAFIYDKPDDAWRTDFFSNGTLTTIYRINNQEKSGQTQEIEEPF